MAHPTSADDLYTREELETLSKDDLIEIILDGDHRALSEDPLEREAPDTDEEPDML